MISCLILRQAEMPVYIKNSAEKTMPRYDIKHLSIARETFLLKNVQFHKLFFHNNTHKNSPTLFALGKAFI